MDLAQPVLDLAQPVRAEIDLASIIKRVGARKGLGLKPDHIIPLYFISFHLNIWPNEKFQKKNQEFEEEKAKIRCLWTQLNFIEGLIEFMEGLITRKINF